MLQFLIRRFDAAFLAYEASNAGHSLECTNPVVAAWKFCKISAAGLVLISVALNLLPLFIAVRMAGLVRLSNTNIVSHDIFVLASLILAFVFLQLASVLFSIRLQRAVCRSLETLLGTAPLHGVPQSAMERLVGRDVPTVLDNLPISLSVVSLPIFIAGASYYLYTQQGDQGLSLILLLFLIAPLVYVISLVSSKNFNNILSIVETRIHLCSQWLQEGPYARQFGDLKQLDVIRASLLDERRARDWDSYLRGADSYIVGFARLLPIAIVGSAAVASDPDNFSVEAFWLAIPLLATILAVPRAVVSYTAAKTCLTKLAAVTVQKRSRDAIPERREFDFDATAPIWPGQLADLISPVDPAITHELLRQFRLVPELGVSAEAVLQTDLVRDGKNLSNGQRERLQLLRAVAQAEFSDAKLIVRKPLLSLDATAQLQIGSYLRTRFSHRVTLPSDWETSAVPETAEQHIPSARKDFAVKHTDAQRQTLMRWFLPRFAAASFLLLIPAMMMTASANVANMAGLALIAYVMAGFAAALIVGVGLERIIRGRAASALLDGLSHVREDNSPFSFQVISSDLTATFERIAWYSHDLAWISALILCTVATLCLAFGFIGAIIAGIFCLALLAVYVGTVERVKVARIRYSSGIDDLTNASLSALSLSEAQFKPSYHDRYSEWLYLTRSRLSCYALKQFFLARRDMLLTRSISSMTSQFVSDVMIILVTVIAMFASTRSDVFILIVSSLLLIRSDLSNVFLAALGFASQTLSAQRLLAFSQQDSSVRAYMASCGIHVPEALYVRERPVTELCRGTIYHLSAPSGAGKSVFLKQIVGILPSEDQRFSVPFGASPVRCFYFNSLIFQARYPRVDEFFAWIGSLNRDEPTLLILDEALNRQSRHEMLDIKRRLEHSLVDAALTVIMVDHRIDVEERTTLTFQPTIGSVI